MNAPSADDPAPDSGRPVPPHGSGGGGDNLRPYNTATGLGDTGRVTSKKAAAKAAGAAAERREAALSLIAAAELRGLTGSELSQRMTLPPGSVRPRLTELFNAGRIVVQKRSDNWRANLNRRNAQGSLENVWVLPKFLRRGPYVTRPEEPSPGPFEWRPSASLQDEGKKQ